MVTTQFHAVDASHPTPQFIAGLPVPFLEVPQAVEGLLTAAEALFTAFDLQKEVQEQK